MTRGSVNDLSPLHGLPSSIWYGPEAKGQNRDARSEPHTAFATWPAKAFGALPCFSIEAMRSLSFFHVFHDFRLRMQAEIMKEGRGRRVSGRLCEHNISQTKTCATTPNKVKHKDDINVTTG
jgi:hypothetical protein